jgi:hypothetical protein
MFFKKKVPVEEYCRQNLTTLFSNDRVTTWEALRRACKDSSLSQVDSQLYYCHLRAVFIQLMLIAITKKCSFDASSDAHVFVMLHLNERGYAEIDEISGGYNQAFGSSGLAPGSDGVSEMVAYFSDALTSDGLQQETIKRLYFEFHAMLKIFLDDLNAQFSLGLSGRSGANANRTSGARSLIISFGCTR